MGVHELRKVLGAVADEDRKDMKDYLRNGQMMNALLLNVAELNMNWVSRMALDHPKMDEKMERKMLMGLKIIDKV
jgi:hypothetical protein